MNTKHPRGIRVPKGYAPGQTSKNFYIASNGNISGDVVKFFDDWTMFFSLCPQSGKYNTPLMRYCGLSKEQVDKFAGTDRRHGLTKERADRRAEMVFSIVLSICVGLCLRSFDLGSRACNAPVKAFPASDLHQKLGEWDDSMNVGEGR